MKGKENSNRKKTCHRWNHWWRGIDLGTSLRGETIKLMIFLDPPKGLKRMRHHACTNMFPTMCSDAVFYRYFSVAGGTDVTNILDSTWTNELDQDAFLVCCWT